MQSEIRIKKSTISKTLKYALVLFIIILVFWFGKLIIESRCFLVTNCQPASWGEIQDVIIKNTQAKGIEYKLDSIPIHIYHSMNTGLTKQDLIEKSEIRVGYVLAEKEKNAYGELAHPIRTIEFDDNNLWISDFQSSGYNFLLPSDDVLERFKRVSVSYIDVYNLTWNKADEALNYPIKSVAILLDLDNKTKDNFKVESTWFVMYTDIEKNDVMYLVDARTGKIIQTK